MEHRRKRASARHHAVPEELARVVAEWTARDLTQSLLESIRTGVFSIARPTTP
jgi:hypothetical protein